MLAIKQGLLSLAILLISCHAFSQQEYVEQWKMKPHRIWVKKLDSKQQLVGWLYATTDSSIIITKKKKWDKAKFEPLLRFKKNVLPQQEVVEIPVQNIKKVKMLKKNKILTGAVTGFVAGATFGAYIGTGRSATSLSNREKLKYRTMLGLPMGVLAACLGIIIGKKPLISNLTVQNPGTKIPVFRLLVGP